MNTPRHSELEIQVLTTILRFFEQNHLRDFDNFGSTLAKVFVQVLITDPENSERSFIARFKNLKTNFFKANKNTSRAGFILALGKALSTMKPAIIQELSSYPQLTISDIFPETKKIRFRLTTPKSLDLEEKLVQDELREALRERGASPIAGRRKDSVLEVADLEHFYMEVRNQQYSFSAVVKGYRSIKTDRISWEAIAHQVLKAHRTKPDYIMVVAAKELKDDVPTEIAMYCTDLQKPHLVIFILPSDLARFLRWRKII